ncbi:MAG: hypothetical protein LBU83_11960 [Bacteroidales bacterium]|jgi:hypothetical protein|nr:hypothetical protein [Bacteroidales bacterium]
MAAVFSAKAIWESHHKDLSAMSVWSASAKNLDAVPVFQSTNRDLSATSVYMSHCKDLGAQAVWMAGCFPKSELVNITSDERVPIGSLNVGDKIGSWDIENKKTQYTAVTEIHRYRVMEIIGFNNSMLVSSSHPLMVMTYEKNGELMPQWKVAFDINIGDHVIGPDNKCTAIRSKRRYWYDTGIEVLNLSTDSGRPFLVRDFVVKANNTIDNIEWAGTPATQRIVA